ncbi:MAG TPA: hypothetical protein VMW43_06810 [Bacteroidota bacterium]|nr:hypothetical protein [Bacteroidota bacterium]
MRIIPAMCVGITVLIACRSESTVGPVPSGEFHYRAYDTGGTLISTGYCTITFTDSVSVTGNWHFEKVDTPPNIGPQTGDGKLAGLLSGGMLSVNLNPGYVDNNVFLRGQFTGTAYSGAWSWSGFPGVINRGTFRAVKQ